jgi:hypothetical protein
MKKRILIIIGISMVVLIALLTWFRYYTKSHSPAATAEYKNENTQITIDYCRPLKKGRLIFGDDQSGALQPYGKYWRMGANEATLFVTNKNLLVNDQHLAAGKYSIYAYPGKDNWQIVFNSVFDRWGVPAPEVEKDVLKTNVSAQNNAPIQEQFLISFEEDSNNLQLVLHWDQTKVFVPIVIEK